MHSIMYYEYYEKHNNKENMLRFMQRKYLILRNDQKNRILFLDIITKVTLEKNLCVGINILKTFVKSSWRMESVSEEIAHPDIPTIANMRNKGVLEEICVLYNHINLEQRKDSLNVSDEKLDVEKVHEDVE